MIKKTIVLFIILAGLISPVFVAAEDLGVQCEALTKTTTGCPNMNQSECQALLQKCSDYYDQQSAKLSDDITKTSQQKNTLANQIAGLKSKIQNLNYQISQGNIMVKDLNMQIADTEVSIIKTSSQIENTQDQIANIIRAIYEEDKKPAFVVLLEGSLSDFFGNIAYLEGLNSRANDLLSTNRNLKNYMEGQQTKMSDNVDQLQKTIAVQTVQKQENEKNQKQQDQYLKMTEAQYQQQLKEKQEVDKKANEIRNRIFQLVGVADTEAPSFGEAVEIAKYVQSITGVNPAFLLAILQQETGIGKNVGRCYLKDTATGSGINITTGASMKNVMKPMGLAGRKGDVNDFLVITEELGRDPFTTPISCPIASVGGYGGAMGPAQFIPTTWAIYRNRLTQILGRPANPWNVRDAFLASGLYLADLGAAGSRKCANGKTAEWGAAQGYFNGTVCTTRNAFYGNNVMAIAARFAEDIKIIGK